MSPTRGTPGRRTGPAGICLAAGASSRMGIPKALLLNEGTPWLEGAVRLLLSGGCDPVVAVLGAEAEEIRAAVPPPPGVRYVVNDRWAEGRSGSVKAGVRAALAAPAWVVLPVDHPRVLAEDVRALVAAWRGSRPPVVRPVHGGRGGHPVLLDAALREDLLALGDDEPLRDLLRGYRDREVRVPASPGVLVDVNTPEDLPGPEGLPPRSSP